MLAAKRWTVTIEIDELAAARALSDLAHHLLDVASSDVEDAVARFRRATACR